MLMAGEQLYFLNESVARGRHVYKHMVGRNRQSTFSRERTTQSLWQFRYFHGEERALCQHLFTALNTPSAIIREPAFIPVQDLWTLALKRDPASKQHNGYLRQYSTCGETSWRVPSPPCLVDSVHGKTIIGTKHQLAVYQYMVYCQLVSWFVLCLLIRDHTVYNRFQWKLWYLYWLVLPSSGLLIQCNTGRPEFH